MYIRNYMPVALLSDASPSACIAAAESIAAFGNDAKAAIDRLVELADPAKHGPYVAMQALASIDALGQKAKPWKDAIAALPTAAPGTDARVREEYIKRLRESISRSIT